ncbi:DUF2723 domain-containing protein [bacterium]|nr:DUF2723 domain-containing protein [bacterium]
MKNYAKWNNIIGWFVWAVATVVFVAAAERTVSWWDCGEYISTSGKLMVGHPPGAPTFQILGCLAQIFTFGNHQYAAFAVNVLSALCSSFTILFLFWTITMLARKVLSVSLKDREAGVFHQVMIYICGAIGALAYTFSDSFWFSSAEGEVYAMSSFFTAITFWAILKWETVADEPHNLRWIIFIAFLVGLAIGVHLLNLLVIPAMVFIIYYKKFKHTKKGFWVSIGISLVLLAAILWGIVPWTVKLAGYFEIFFVNSIGLPFNSGTVIYFVVLVAALVWGLRYAYRKNRVVLHTGLLCLCFMLIGYSTFFTLVIRSNAQVPINENEPKDALSLLSYLNREQYGSRPLFYGQYFNARPVDSRETSAQYVKDEASGKYKVVGHGVEYIYDKEHCGLFPRMYSSESGGGRPHVEYYRFWSGTDAKEGSPKPTALENMRFLVRYHFGWMYFRYFMWNFAGRQNNIQGLGYNRDGSRDVLHGNWISGIKPLDALRLGPQDNLPGYLRNNPGRNTFFMLPLLLGICGLIYHGKKHKQGAFVVFLLFFMTGLAIILYLNQPSTEPRERDYAYAGSFYAFAIWIGLGVMALTEWIGKKVKPHIALAGVGVLSLVFVPGLMAQQGWDDHNRSHRTAAYDFALNTLESCSPDGVLIANGDNDTFPLWYCQEMEGIRTDVRIINSALANSFWHIQPLFRAMYDAEPLKFTIPYGGYGQGVNDYAFLGDMDLGGYTELSDLLRFVGSDNPATKQRSRDGELVSFFPSRKAKVTLPVQEMLNQGLLTPEQAQTVPSELRYTVKPGSSVLYRADLAFLDIFATNKFGRPIHVLSTGAQSGVFPVNELASVQGNVYRLVPYRNANRAWIGANGMETDKTYDLFVNKFRWGNLQDPKTAVDPESAGYAGTVRYQYSMLARALNFEGKYDSAVNALDKCLEFFPDRKVPYEGIMVYLVEEYFRAGAYQKGLALASDMRKIYTDRLQYMARFPARFARSVRYEQNDCLGILHEMNRRIKPFASLDKTVAEFVAQTEENLQAYGI